MQRHNPGGNAARGLLRCAATSCTRLRSFCSPASAKIDGTGSVALVLGGFGFTERQLRRHEALYEEHDFEVVPKLFSIKELCSPTFAHTACPQLARDLEEMDKPLVVHAVSGSFWIMTYMLAHMTPEWRERRVRAIMFDSCPPKPDHAAFGGFFAWYLQVKLGVPARLSKPVVSRLCQPFIGLLSEGAIDQDWLAQNDRWMWDEQECAIPRAAALLFIRGRNDTVLDAEHVDAFAAFLKTRSSSTVESRLFERAQHAMAVLEAPEAYKRHHVDDLLALVPEWRAGAEGAS
jgi:hypothetical protein